MANFTITDVRAIPGDSAFLIDDGKTSILYDSGFAFTGPRIADRIKQALGERSLDYIFLTHSHYDHALGSVYVRRAYPEAQVVAGVYAEKIFRKPTARAVMRDLDRKAARSSGVTEYEDLIDALRVDIPVRDGDTLHCGSMDFTVVELPGHTKCSVGFYLSQEKLLLSTETLGVYFGNGIYLPSYLVGYQMAMDSFEKAKKLEIEHLLLPHYGLVSGAEARRHLENAEAISRETATVISRLLLSGKSPEEAAAWFEKTVYSDQIQPIYPIDAFRLNTAIMIGLIQKEKGASL